MAKQTKQTIEKRWTDDVAKLLVGKKVKSVRYMTQEEVDHFMWHKRAIVIMFTDGTAIFPSADDEGNDGGSIFTTDDELQVIPTL